MVGQHSSIKDNVLLSYIIYTEDGSSPPTLPVSQLERQTSSIRSSQGKSGKRFLECEL